MRKYEFTGETMEFEGHTLNRILYLRSFGKIEKGDVGGWIEHEGNLSHDDLSVVLDEAKVFGNARIEEDARVDDEAIVKDNALIKGVSFVFQKANIGADTICENSLVSGESQIFFYSSILDFSENEETSAMNSNLKSCTISGKTIVEGTGQIILSNICSSELHGVIDFKNVRIDSNKAEEKRVRWK